MLIHEHREGDWGFSADDPQGALDGYVAHWCFWWNEDCQGRFAALWGADAETLADELADRYAFAWPWLIPRMLPTRAPTTQALIEEFLEDQQLVARTNGTNPRTVLDVSTVWGSFNVVRKRRSWRSPSTAVCPICGIEFWNGELPVWTYAQFGAGRYCYNCCVGVRNGRQQRWSRRGVVHALSELASAFDAIPSQAYAFELLPVDAPDERRDRWMRALCAMPDAATVKRVLAVQDWLGALQVAGIVGEGWRPSFGTWCRAGDGHRCRSLLEKSIDDWFSHRDLAHECEPFWPVHPILNPHGRKRADWCLPSGSFVECAGMMKKSSYADKIEQKQRLALDLGLKLYIVGPTDLLDLDSVFANEI